MKVLEAIDAGKTSTADIADAAKLKAVDVLNVLIRQKTLGVVEERHAAWRRVKRCLRCKKTVTSRFEYCDIKCRVLDLTPRCAKCSSPNYDGNKLCTKCR